MGHILYLQQKNSNDLERKLSFCPILYYLIFATSQYSVSLSVLWATNLTKMSDK